MADSTNIVDHTCPAVDCATEVAQDSIIEAKDALIESFTSSISSLLNKSLKQFENRNKSYSYDDILGLINGLIDDISLGNTPNACFEAKISKIISTVNSTVKEKGTYKLREGLDQTLNEKESLESELYDFKKDIKSLEEQISNLESELSESKSALEKASDTILDLESEIEDLNSTKIAA